MNSVFKALSIATITISMMGCHHNTPGEKPVRFQFTDYNSLQKDLKEKMNIDLVVANDRVDECADMQIRCMIGGNYGNYGDYGNCRGFNDLTVAEQKVLLPKLSALKEINIAADAMSFENSGEAIILNLYTSGQTYVGNKVLSDSRKTNGKKPENRIYIDSKNPTVLKVETQFSLDNAVITNYKTSDLAVFDKVDSDMSLGFYQGLKDGSIQYVSKTAPSGRSCGEAFVVDIREVFTNSSAE